MKKQDFDLDGKLPSNVKDLEIILSDPRIRLKVYLYMIDEINERRLRGSLIGMCFCVPEFISMVDDDCIQYRLGVLPELWDMKPQNHWAMFGNYWFADDDFESRLNLLNKIVDNLSKTIENI